MADVKVSALTELLGASLAPETDSLLVSDMSARLSKRMTPANVMRAAFHNLSSVYDFTTGSVGPWVAFTRASAAWYENGVGIITGAASDAPRFQYNPVTLAPHGLLIEGARTELYTKNRDFADAVWSKTNLTVNSKVIMAPDGTMSADELIEGTVGTSQAVGQSAMTFTSGVTYIHRVFAKAKTRNWLAVYWDPIRFGGTGFTYFDLATGSLGSISSNMSAFIRPVANGFYECAVIGTCVSTGAGNRSFWLANANGGRVYSGDGVSSLYLWGASLQVGSELTQHTDTDTSTVAVANDVPLVTNPAALTDQCWVVRGRTPRKIAGGGTNTIFQIDDGTVNNRRLIYLTSGNSLRATAIVGGVTQCDLNLGTIANDTDISVAVRWADNNFAASLNGGSLVTDLSGTNPYGLTTARIGSAINTSYWNSTIKRIETRRTATDAELQSLSV